MLNTKIRWSWERLVPVQGVDEAESPSLLDGFGTEMAEHLSTNQGVITSGSPGTILYQRKTPFQ